jgi:hypothetical protein
MDTARAALHVAPFVPRSRVATALVVTRTCRRGLRIVSTISRGRRPENAPHGHA